MSISHIMRAHDAHAHACQLKSFFNAFRFTPRQRSDHRLTFKSMNLRGNLCIDLFSSLFFFMRFIHLKDCMEYYQCVLHCLLLFLEMASEKLPSRDSPYVTE